MNEYVELIVKATLGGFGTAVGSFFATTYALNHSTKLQSMITKRVRRWRK